MAFHNDLVLKTVYFRYQLSIGNKQKTTVKGNILVDTIENE